jgi:lipoprotein NlpD
MAIILAALLAACSAVPARPGNPGVTRLYVVERGDTLSQIAQGLGVPMADLARANGLAPPYRIEPGQRLRLPPGKGVASRRPTSTPLMAPSPAAPAPAAGSPVVQALPQGYETAAPPVKWPADGALVGRFGVATATGKPNSGIDLSLLPGQRIIAAAAGTVLFAGVEPGLGQLVVIDHGGGWFTAYAFTGTITVTNGEVVESRERIGVNAATGHTLHFELRRDSVPRDPLPYLPPRL